MSLTFSVAYMSNSNFISTTLHHHNLSKDVKMFYFDFYAS